MRISAIAGLAFLFLAAGARAEDKCAVKGSFGGKPVALKSCAVAFFDEKSVTIWFTESPVSADEAATFQISSYAEKKDPQNKPRTMVSLAFCVGKKPAPAEVKEVSIEVNHAASPMLQQSWVVALPADKDVKLVKLAGDPKPGGRLSGKLTGSKKEQDRAFTWDADFDVQLPQKQAAAGLSCS